MFFLSMKLLVHQLVNVLCFYFEVRLVHFPPCSAQLDAGVVALDGAERLAGRLEEQSGEGRPDRRTERERRRRGEENLFSQLHTSFTPLLSSTSA